MLDPKIADGFFRVGKGEAVGGFRVREAGRVEIHAHAVGFRPVDPAREMLRRDFVAIDLFAAELAVESVKIEAVLAGDEGKRLVEVGAEFVRSAGLAGVVAGHRNAAAEAFTGVFKAADVVALPAVKGNRNARKRGHGGIGIDAEIGVSGLGELVGLGDGF